MHRDLEITKVFTAAKLTKIIQTKKKKVKKMEKYNYYKQVREDVKDFILLNYTLQEFFEAYNWSEEDFANDLYDSCFFSCVTGKDNGAYFRSSEESREAVSMNFDLLQEAFKYFGVEDYSKVFDAEYCDVTIRCYILGQVIPDAIEDAKEEYEENE